MKPGARAVALMVLFGAWGVACGATQARLSFLSTDWQDDAGLSIGRIWAKSAGTRVVASADVVVGIARQGDVIVALSLASGKTWTYSHPLDARPVVAGTLVVGAGDGDLFALDAADGRLVWRVPAGALPLIGAGDDGAVTVATLQQPGASGSVLIAVERGGRVVRRIETGRTLGVPAVLGGNAFVPWAGQYVSVLDLSTGEEQARVTLRERTSRAWAEGGSLWFGELGFTRFDEHIRDASAGRASRIDLPARKLPGEPKLAARGAAALPTVANAQDRVRLYARPSVSEAGLALSDDRFYATYFRLAMGFESKGAKLAWVHVHDVDFLGGAVGAIPSSGASSGQIVLCDEAGAVTALDAKTGSVVFAAHLGQPVRACVVSVDAWGFQGGAPAAKPLAIQLAEAVATPDPQLAAIQRVLLEELAPMPDPSATRALLDLATDPRAAPDLVKDARTALAKRSNGASDMLEALRLHVDYLHDVLRGPPVGPIAQALSAMHEQAAAPLLAAHLLDPEDSPEDVRQVGSALAVLAGPPQAPALRQFFGMYRATADSDDVAAAVVSVGRALIALKIGAEQVKAAASSPMTVPAVREGLSSSEAPASP